MFENFAEALDNLIEAMADLLSPIVEAVVTSFSEALDRVTPTTYEYGGVELPDRTGDYISGIVSFSSPSVGG